MWKQAKHACICRGMALASIRSRRENEAVSSLMSSTNSLDGVWIGVTYDDEMSGTLSTRYVLDNSPATYTNWKNGKPDNIVGSSTGCVMMEAPVDKSQRAAGLWTFASCGQKKLGYVCETAAKPRSRACKMVDNNWSGGKPYPKRGCYELFTILSTWEVANQFCRSRGASLAKVKDDYENRAIKEMVADVPEMKWIDGIWLGISGRGAQNEREWTNTFDDTPTEYFNWKQGESGEIDETGNSNCVAMLPAGDSNAGSWFNNNCDEKYYAFVCSTPYSMGRTCMTDGRCYELYNYPFASQERAHEMCMSLGMMGLASIRSQEDQNAIKALVKSLPRQYQRSMGSRMQFGLITDTDENQVWRYTIDGSVATFSYWHLPSVIPGERCGVMISNKYSHHANFEWRTMPCNDTMSYSFLCETRGWRVCSQQQEGPKCFRYLDLNKRWLEADEYCKSNGMALAGPRSATDTHSILSAIHTYDQYGSANVWLGITDKGPQHEGLWRYAADGRVVSYFNWRPGAPNRLQDEYDCVILDTTSGLWSDADCRNRRLPFVCEEARHPVQGQCARILRTPGLIVPYQTFSTAASHPINDDIKKLRKQVLRFTWNSLTQQYDTCRYKSKTPPGPKGGKRIDLTDEVYARQDLAGSVRPIAFFGVEYSQIFIGKHGYVTFGSGAGRSDPETFFKKPRIAAFMSPLIIEKPKAVRFKQTKDTLTVTYKNVLSEAESPANSGQFTEAVTKKSFTFQIHIDTNDNSIYLWYNSRVSSHSTAMIGLSNGLVPNNEEISFVDTINQCRNGN